MIVVNSKDGSILFNPTKEGISEILYSKLFPEGIMATAKINNENVQLFLSFSSWKIEWIKEGQTQKNTEGKINNAILGLMTNSSNSRETIIDEIAKSDLYTGNYINGNYIVKNTERKTISSFNILKGSENWVYNSERPIQQYIVRQDETKENTIIYLKTLSSNNKSNIVVLDYMTGTILWEKDLDYRVDKLKIIGTSLSVLVSPATDVIGKRYYQIYDKKGESL